MSIATICAVTALVLVLKNCGVSTMVFSIQLYVKGKGALSLITTNVVAPQSVQKVKISGLF